jgi:DMSO/TMAO reductase YedYZ heme-binding membrane subunit
MARPVVRERAPQQKAERALAATRTAIDAWMEHDFKFAGSHVKRRTVACCLVGVFALTPLFLVSRPIIQLDRNTLNQVEPDIGGTGSMLLLLATLSITPLVTLTRSHWFVPLRRWFGIMVAITATTDAIVGGLTSSFAGGFIGHLTGHTFLLVGLCMVMIMAPLALTSNNRAQRALGKYWKPLQRLTYVVWALLFIHLALLEGFGFQNGTNGPSSSVDGDPILHQRLYQLTACSIPLLLLRMPPVKRWVARKQQAGKQRDVYLTFLPLAVLFVVSYSFIINELMFKGISAFREQPVNG